MERLLVVAVVVAGALVVAAVARRRATVAVRSGVSVPRHVHRHELAGPDAPWLVLAFTSSTCRTCADVIDQVHALASAGVAVMIADEHTDAAIHRRYGIDSVPIVVIADADGAIRESFVGPARPGRIRDALDGLTG